MAVRIITLESFQLLSQLILIEVCIQEAILSQVAVGSAICLVKLKNPVVYILLWLSIHSLLPLVVDRRSLVWLLHVVWTLWDWGWVHNDRGILSVYFIDLARVIWHLYSHLLVLNNLTMVHLYGRSSCLRGINVRNVVNMDRLRSILTLILWGIFNEHYFGGTWNVAVILSICIHQSLISNLGGIIIILRVNNFRSVQILMVIFLGLSLGVISLADTIYVCNAGVCVLTVVYRVAQSHWLMLLFQWLWLYVSI